MFTTQKVLITPVSFTSTSTDVGSPVFGSVPRDAAYTSSDDGARPPMIFPSPSPLRYRVVAVPAVSVYSSRTGTVIPVTGASSTAGGDIGAGSGSSPSPSGTHASMSPMLPVRSARHRGATR